MTNLPGLEQEINNTENFILVLIWRLVEESTRYLKRSKEKQDRSLFRHCYFNGQLEKNTRLLCGVLIKHISMIKEYGGIAGDRR